jgi:hypothetical protein
MLEAFTDGLRPLFDNLGDKIANYTELRDPLTARSQYDLVNRLRLGAVRTPLGKTEQRGVDGSINSSHVFTSPTARFSQADVGKQLLILNSAVPVNNSRAFAIASIVNTTSALCDPPVVVDSGPLQWQVQTNPPLPADIIRVELRGGDVSDVTPGWTLFDGFSQFEVEARRQFYPISNERKTLTEREGSLGVALNDGRFQVETPFTQQDFGKKVTVSGSSITLDNDKFEIMAVDPTSPTIVSFSLPLTVEGVTIDGTVIYAYRPGTSGISVIHTGKATDIVATTFADVANDIITIVLASNGTSITGTANSIIAAVAAIPAAAALVTVTNAGTGAGLGQPSTLALIPGTSLAPDGGPLVWALLPFPQFDLVGTVPPAGVVQQEGVDLAIGQINASTATTATGRFTQNDVGKLLVVRGSANNQDGYATVTAVQNLNQIVVGSFTNTSWAIAETNLTWELRTVSAIGDTTQADVNAPSLLAYLAEDFGIELDTRENEARQRSWVETLNQWVNLKGTDHAYRIIGALSGYDVTMIPLFRISVVIAAGLPGASVYIIGDTDPGRHGTDGYLFLAGGVVSFTAASANFTNALLGTQISITNAATPANDKTYTIAVVVDAHTVQFLNTDTASTPDAGSGTSLAPTLTWEIVRYYTNQLPTRPRFDEINGELMQTIVGVSHFLPDMYCFDPNSIDSFTVNITAATPTVSTGVPINYQVTAVGLTQAGTGNFSTCAVILGLGNWKITDTAGNLFWVESVPIRTVTGPPEVHTFNVFSSVVPVTGTATITYICPTLASCDYCKSNRVLAVISPGEILTEHPDSLALEDAFARVVRRLEQEVKPAHVDLVPVMEQQVRAGLILTATFNQ